MTTIYEKRTYSVIVGKMAEVLRLYKTLGWPALEAGGFSKHLIGYFTSDTGELHQLVHCGASTATTNVAPSGSGCSKTRTSWPSQPSFDRCSSGRATNCSFRPRGGRIRRVRA